MNQTYYMSHMSALLKLYMMNDERRAQRRCRGGLLGWNRKRGMYLAQRLNSSEVAKDRCVRRAHVTGGAVEVPRAALRGGEAAVRLGGGNAPPVAVLHHDWFPGISHVLVEEDEVRFFAAAET